LAAGALTRVPRYFFHVHDSVDLLDNDGTELAGPDEARVQAVVTAGELLRDVGGRFWNSPEWRLCGRPLIGIKHRLVLAHIASGEDGAHAFRACWRASSARPSGRRGHGRAAVRALVLTAAHKPGF
jgi:hypothetical protein